MLNNPDEFILKAAKDKAFREKLVKNPKATLKEFGLDLPEGMEIEFHIETENKKHVVIPYEMQSMEDKELEGITGGAYGQSQTRAQQEASLQSSPLSGFVNWARKIP